MALPNIYALTDTRWSNAGTTLNGIWLDINNGAVGAGIGTADSKVIRLTNNLSNFFAVSLSGWCGACIPAGDGGFAFTNFEGYVDYTRLFSSQRFTAAGGVAGRSNVVICNGGNLGYTTPADGAFAFNSVATGIGVDAGNPGNNDVWLRRDAANTLALRNGTNAQTFNVYNTFTDSSNYERMSFGFDGNGATLTWQNAGTGSARSFNIRSGLISATTIMGMGIGAAIGGGPGFIWGDNFGNNWCMLDGARNAIFFPVTDNLADLGKPSTNRVRSLYLSQFTNLGVFTWGSVSASIIPAEGMMIGCSTAATIAAGATVAASGTGHALIYYDGTQWKACN